MKFIDPKIDFAFKKIFGSENAKDVLISFLESLLGLEGDRRIAELTLLDPFQTPKIRDLKYSILDVKCRDHRGINYIVEMQVQKVSAFLKRIQYNAAKAYASQIERGEDYPRLNQVIAVTIVDFSVWDGFEHCVSRHEMRESVTGQSFLQDILHIFVELPKFEKSLEQLNDILDRWIYFIRYADSLKEIPPQLQAAPFHHAFEMALVANMTADELELYEKAGIAIADARGMVELAKAEGRAEGRAEGIQLGEQRGKLEGRVEALLDLLQDHFGTVPEWVPSRLASADLATLKAWGKRILGAEKIEHVFQ
ncbi:MAG: Rpn family recombination-promoting nuclease/putative transposase [Magnetococcales bacterium]|nr:Rpn family recombination-promoting nuclease/putative transposase [Magnetococcales bacterium]